LPRKPGVWFSHPPDKSKTGFVSVFVSREQSLRDNSDSVPCDALYTYVRINVFINYMV